MIEEISRIFCGLGIKRGDAVLLYSNIASIAKIVDVRKLGTAASRTKMLDYFHESIKCIIGETGTILTLGSFTDFARYGVPFYVEKSLPDQSLGAYPRHLFSKPGCIRSFNPTSNLIALGAKASLLAARSNATAYGLGTPWEKLINHSAKIVFWDTTLRHMTFGHHIEQCVGVPHVYSKIYDTPIYFQDKALPFPAITSVRYLDFGIRYNMRQLELEAKRDGAVSSIVKDKLVADVVECETFASYLTEKLVQNPYYLLDEPPKFKKGQVPFDGNAGPENTAVSNVIYSN